MNTPSDAFQTALAHHRTGAVDEAAACYRQILADDPNNTDAIFNLAALLAAQGQSEAALKLYEQMLESHSDDADTLNNFGNLLQSLGRDGDAEASYRKAIAAEPFQATAHANLGNLLVNLGRTEEAISCYQEALTLDPFDASAHNNMGTALVSQRQPEQARHHFEQAIRRDPGLAEAFRNLGNLALTAGDFDTAEPALRRAIELAPQWGTAHMNLALLLDRKHASEEAELHFRQACELDPYLVEGWQGLAILLQRLNRFDEAYDAIGQAGRIEPDNALTAYQMGNVLSAQGRTDEALVKYRQASALDPRSADYLNAIGTVLHESDRSDEAIPVLEQALALRPEFPEALNNVGNALVNLHRATEAVPYYERALAIDPANAPIACNLGNVYREAGQFKLAHKWFEQALEHAPDLANAHNGIGLCLQSENRHHEAIAAFELALEIQEDYVEALNNAAVSHTELGNYANAIAIYDKVIDLKPDLIQAYFNMGNLLQHVARWDESIAVFYKGLEVRSDYAAIHPFLAHSLMQQCNWRNLNAILERIRVNIEHELAGNGAISISAFALQGLPGDFSMALRQRVAERICFNVAKGLREIREELPFPHTQDRGHKKLRIGYMSPDFRFHSVAVAFLGLLQHHDREQFEIYGYSLHPGTDDALTEELKKGFNKFTKLAAVPLRQAAQRIYDDEIDILIDLAGHTRGTRLDILSMRPAPVQAHYLGYSATIGAKFLDYVITDHHQVPEEQRQFFTEELVYLPDTFMATHKAAVSEEVPSRADCGLPEGAFVFANFNGAYKFDPDTFGTWMRLLRQTPGSVFWCMAGTPGSRKNLRAEAESRGVDPDRLIFAEKVTHPRHLARLVHADLALDNRFHGGGVTTVDCLWTGLPVITVTGATPQSRNGATLLSAIGLPELITQSVEEYEQLALSLARDPARLADLKARLRANCETQPLFDAHRLTQHLERAFAMMWERYQAGDPPAVIDVPPIDATA